VRERGEKRESESDRVCERKRDGEMERREIEVCVSTMVSLCQHWVVCCCFAPIVDGREQPNQGNQISVSFFSGDQIQVRRS